jgi:hypothetical protein
MMLLVGLVGLGTAAGSAGAQQFSAWPSVLRVIPSADSGAVAVIQIRNDGGADLPLRFYAGDFDQDEAGEHRFLELGEHPRSCGDRLQVFPSGAMLRPGEFQEVRVSLGQGARACWSFVYAEVITQRPDGISVGQRIGVKLLGLPLGSVEAGEITTVGPRALPRHVAVEVEFRNTGEGPLRPAGSVEIRTVNGDVVATGEVRPFTVLPGAKRRVLAEVPAVLPAGRYVTVVLIDFGGEYISGGQAVFESNGAEPSPVAQGRRDGAP